MFFFKHFRQTYIKTTNFTHGFQGEEKKVISFYKWWSNLYDFSVKIDPAYPKGLEKMISLVVSKEDTVLDIGCGTGLGSIAASKIAKEVMGIDISQEMVGRLKRKIEKLDINNIQIMLGEFPSRKLENKKFECVISSFTIAHFREDERLNVYKDIFKLLKDDGKLGLFLAQGEIAPTFETKDAIESTLRSAGFKDIVVEDLFDVYRIVTALKEENKK